MHNEHYTLGLHTKDVSLGGIGRQEFCDHCVYEVENGLTLTDRARRDMARAQSPTAHVFVWKMTSGGSKPPKISDLGHYLIALENPSYRRGYPFTMSMPRITPGWSSTEVTAAQSASDISVYAGFGVFRPVKAAGSGTTLIELGDASAASVIAVSATHGGGSKFAIRPVTHENTAARDLVYSDGHYSGTTLLTVKDVARLWVTSDLSWAVTLSPIQDMKEITLPTDGEGDNVLLYSGDVDHWVFSHKNSRFFEIDQITASAHYQLDKGLPGDNPDDVVQLRNVNEGPSIISIQTDGTWTLKSRSGPRI